MHTDHIPQTFEIRLISRLEVIGACVFIYFNPLRSLNHGEIGSEIVFNESWCLVGQRSTYGDFENVRQALSELRVV